MINNRGTRKGGRRQGRTEHHRKMREGKLNKNVSGRISNLVADGKLTKKQKNHLLSLIHLDTFSRKQGYTYIADKSTCSITHQNSIKQSIASNLFQPYHQSLAHNIHHKQSNPIHRTN